MQQELTGVQHIFTVSEFASRLERWFEAQYRLRNISISGEISGWRVLENGSAYFKLKDAGALLECFAFASRVRAFPKVEDGSAVVATGSVSTYKQRSQYQLLVQDLRHTGLGELYIEQERLKAQFAREGLFELDRKRRLPRYAFSVALVSKRGGQGQIDFCSELQQNAPHVDVTIIDAPVQGVGSGPEIAEALDRANKTGADVIVLVRGGGSFEDLFVFSTEPVVRAIARSKTPVITGVGHKADTFLCDLVSDYAAPTPGLAAIYFSEARNTALQVLAVHRRQMMNQLNRAMLKLEQRRDSVSARLVARISGYASVRHQRLRALEKSLEVHSPVEHLTHRRERLAVAKSRLRHIRERLVTPYRARLEHLRPRLPAAMQTYATGLARALLFARTRLGGKNPETILSAGYAIVRARGRVLTRAEGVNPSDEIEAQLARGSLTARVERVNRYGG